MAKLPCIAKMSLLGSWPTNYSSLVCRSWFSLSAIFDLHSQYGRNMQPCNTKASLPCCTKLQIHCWRHKSGKPSVCWAKLWDDPRSIYSSKFTSPISCQNWWKVHISGYTCEKTDTHGRIHVGTRQTSWERVIKKCDSVLFIFTGPFIDQNTWTHVHVCIVSIFNIHIQFLLLFFYLLIKKVVRTCKLTEAEKKSKLGDLR